MEIRIRPNSRPQAEFFAATEYEVLYGGAAGGGKTWALVVDPLPYIGYSEFTGVIFRRTFPQLEGSVLPTTYRIYPAAGGEYNSTSRVWKFPSGATIRLGYMQYEDSWNDYKGHNYTYQGFDELTDFVETQYEMMQAWNRSYVAGIPAYRRSASNPGGIGHTWVKKRFPLSSPPRKLGSPVWSELAKMWWQPMSSGPRSVWRDAGTGLELTRKFIPAKVFDNVDFLRADPQYLARLLSLSPHRRRALLDGDWDVFEGQFFDNFSRDGIHVTTSQSPHRAYTVLGSIDYGDRTALEIAFRDFEGNIVFFSEYYSEGRNPVERALAIAQHLVDRELFSLEILCDANMGYAMANYTGMRESPLKIFQDVLSDRMAGSAPNLRLITETVSKGKGFRAMANEVFKSYLHWEMRDSRVLRPKLYITRDCPRLIDCLTELVFDQRSTGGMDFIQGPSVKDDAYDAAKHIVMQMGESSRPASAATWLDKMLERQVVDASGGWKVGDP